jgi:UDP-GlcNAc3NAcA epimerase
MTRRVRAYRGSQSEGALRLTYCLGTRPEVIRSARLLQLMANDPSVELTVINSGQHYDGNMFGAFFAELRVPPAATDLGVTGDPVEQMAEIIRGAGLFFGDIPADAICVFGDTNSSLAFALAAARLHIPLVHIEAGCRSYDMSMPEEVNRRLIDHCADYLLAVSELGASNLRGEGVPGRIEVVGDPLFDVYSRMEVQAGVRDRPHGLLTLHRPANVDNRERLGAILDQVVKAANRSGLDWIFPVHPRTRHTLPESLPSSIVTVEPLPYAELIAVLRSAPVCVTDSGGLQKEALWAHVPCVTIRPNTEWMETIWQRSNVLAPLGSDITRAIIESLDRTSTRDFSNPYGDGTASERVVDSLKDWFLREKLGSRQVPEVELQARWE